MGIGNPPSAPTAAETMASAQAGAGQQQAMNFDAAKKSQTGSMVGQENVYGGLKFVADPSQPGGYRLDINLSPEQQALYSQLMQTKGTAGLAGGSMLSAANYGGAPGTGGVGNDPTAFIGDLSEGTVKQRVDSMNEFLQPQFDYSRDRLDTQMRNQGIMPGSPAYTQAMRELELNQQMTMSKNVADWQNQAWTQAKDQYLMPANIATQLAAFGAHTDPNGFFRDTPAFNMSPASIAAIMDSVNSANKIRADQDSKNYENMMKAFGQIGGAAAGSVLGPAGSAVGTALGDKVVNFLK